MNSSVTILQLVIVFGILIISVVLHEIMHGLVAHRLGDDTAKLSGRLTLNPLNHIDPFATILLPLVLVTLGLPPFGAAKPVPVDYRRLKYGDAGMALVAVAGPLTNLGIAAIFGAILRLSPSLLGTATGEVVQLFIQVNLSFFVFNMIPFPPLDGSRLLYALAPESVQNFMRYIESMGLAAIVMFMLVIFPLLRPTMIESVLWLQRALIGI